MALLVIIESAGIISGDRLTVLRWQFSRREDCLNYTDIVLKSALDVHLAPGKVTT